MRGRVSKTKNTSPMRVINRSPMRGQIPTSPTPETERIDTDHDIKQVNADYNSFMRTSGT
jgi:hypothetical protein